MQVYDRLCWGSTEKFCSPDYLSSLTWKQYDFWNVASGTFSIILIRSTEKSPAGFLSPFWNVSSQGELYRSNITSLLYTPPYTFWSTKYSKLSCVKHMYLCWNFSLFGLALCLWPRCRFSRNPSFSDVDILGRFAFVDDPPVAIVYLSEMNRSTEQLRLHD